MLNITFNVYQSMFALRKSGFENLHFEVFDKSYFAYVAKCNKIKVNKLGLLRKETLTYFRDYAPRCDDGLTGDSMSFR